jgi:hypothetical protein
MSEEKKAVQEEQVDMPMWGRKYFKWTITFNKTADVKARK